MRIHYHKKCLNTRPDPISRPDYLTIRLTEVVKLRFGQQPDKT